MFNTSENPFDVQRKIQIPESAQLIFVADMFVEDYVGGAELTSEALIDSSPVNVFKLHSKDVTLDLLHAGHKKFWVFGNWTQLDLKLIPTIVGNMSYAILEYDFKFCRYRSPELHLEKEGHECDCENHIHGKITSAFYYGAMGLYWMSERQMMKYQEMFPFLAEKDNIVLSSVFSAQTLEKIRALREGISQSEKEKWIVLNSPSWVKGAANAQTYCEENNLEYEQIWNLSYDQTLATLAAAKGFVYLPAGSDTCPRMVIEAKLLGCELKLNDYVLHHTEEWFNVDDLQSIEDYLLAAPSVFWNSIKRYMEYSPSISGYTTTYNCVKQEYPFEKSIQSMLQFCDEVCVVDGGSTDGTLERLAEIAYPTLADKSQYVDIATQTLNNGELPEKFGDLVAAIRVKVIKRDWSHPRHAIFDGMQKAEARKMCTKEFCWQMDSDEIVHQEHAAKVKDLCVSVRGVDLICLPVIEYWGSVDKVRIDVTPWKWRLSRNRPYITHGIPSTHRAIDEYSQPYAMEGTDGCDMINLETGEPIPCLNFWNNDMEKLRQAALQNSPEAIEQYQQLFNVVTQQLPSVFHYSWFDIERKIKLYRDYWQNHWNALYNKSTEDTAENNNFFGIPWSDVTDEMIKERAKELSEKTGGWIFHQPWNGQCLPHITMQLNQPDLMQQ